MFRKQLAAFGVASLVSVAGCDFRLGPSTWGGIDGCTSTCEAFPWVTPYSPNILRGDTIRFLACNDYTTCGSPNDTGNVVSKWTVPDSSVVTLANGNSATLVPAATSVLVRAVGNGRTALTTTFSKGGGGYSPIQSIRVADSSDIKAIELPMYPFTDTLRVNVVQYFSAHLRDVGGNIYRATPSVSSSDTTVLRITKSQGYGYSEFKIVGLKAGKASIAATFGNLSATRQLTVVP